LNSSQKAQWSSFATNDYQDFDGSPYLNEKFAIGTLILHNDMEVTDIPIKIDLHKNSVVAKNEKGEEVILESRYYKQINVNIDGKDLVFKKINPANPDKYYEVLYEDTDMVFFKKQSAKIFKGSFYTNTSSRFKTNTEYFIKHDDGEIAKVRLKKKEIFAGFMDAELYAMQEYARRNGIKLKEDSDFVAVFEGVKNTSQED
jgi:hypothetical protein